MNPAYLSTTWEAGTPPRAAGGVIACAHVIVRTLFPMGSRIIPIIEIPFLAFVEQGGMNDAHPNGR